MNALTRLPLFSRRRHSARGFVWPILVRWLLVLGCFAPPPAAGQQSMELLPPVDAPSGGSFTRPADPLSVATPDSSVWYNPASWWDAEPWDIGFELGLNGSDGNAEAFSILAGSQIERKTDNSTWKVDLKYGKNQSRDVLTQHYAILDSRWDWKFSAARWRIFDTTFIEYDEFKQFDIRLMLNAGLGYDVIQSDPLTWTVRFGAGASREFGGVEDEWIPEAVFGSDYDHKLSDRQRLTLNIDYLPSWSDFADYRLLFKSGWEILLDEATNMSLKLGVIDRYDSTPHGAKPNDLNYFATLLWRF